MSANVPMFSIVMPVFNKAEYVLRSISSVLSQSFPDFELLIVCDPSTDNSEELVRSVEDKRVQVYSRTSPGAGGYAARNLGISKARGRWVTFLDADDTWYPEFLDCLYRLHVKYPETHILCSAKYIEKDQSTNIDTFSSLQSEEDALFSFEEYLRLSYLHDKPFNSNSVAFERSLLPEGEKLFPDGRTKRSGDIYAWVKIAYLSGSFAWSSYVGSHTYKDIVGVSKTSHPNVMLFREMVNEIRHECTPKELLWLRRYANRLIRVAWLESNRYAVKQQALFNLLFWKNHTSYCLFWSIVSIFPRGLLKFVRDKRSAVR